MDMVVLPSSVSIPHPYAAEILEVEQGIQAVQQQIWELAVAYQQQASQRIVIYVMEQVRHTCTHEYPEGFLRLSFESQASLLEQSQILALELRDQLQQIDLEESRDPWLTLEEAIGPHLEATQQLLDQLYQQMQIGSGQDGPLTTLRWLEMEMTDPELKGLRAHLQVTSARLARLHRQGQQWERKQQIAEAEARWVQLQAPGHSDPEGATMSSGSDRSDSSEGSIGM